MSLVHGDGENFLMTIDTRQNKEKKDFYCADLI